jgi:hypothetical protein
LQGDVTGFEFRHWVEMERLFTERPVGTLLHLAGALRLERESDWVLASLPPQGWQKDGSQNPTLRLGMEQFLRRGAHSRYTNTNA